MKKLVVAVMVVVLAASASGQVLKGSKPNAAASTQKVRVDPALKSRASSLSQQYRQHQQDYQRFQQVLARAKSSKGANQARIAEFERQLNSAGSQLSEAQALQQQASQLDSTSDMSQEQQLKMQMAMDRYSKMMTTLSNILKKMSDTQSSITQNMK